jgi:antitoxin component YwqK of YwqJK toxin-antitoxin module
MKDLIKRINTLVCLFILVHVSFFVFSQEESTFTQNGIVFQGYSNNQLKQGVWEGFRNGVRAEVRTYLNDSMNGIYIKFDTTGKIIEIRDYKNNELNGIRMMLDSGQKVKDIKYYNDGDVSGLNFSYFRNGKIRKEALYPTKGLLNNINSSELFNDDMGIEFFLDDSTLFDGNLWYENGNKRLECMIDLSEDTTYVFFNQYYPDKKLLRVGCIKSYYDKVSRIRTWSKCCVWKCYDIYGNLTNEKQYSYCPPNRP